MSSHWTVAEVARVIHSSLIYFQYRNRSLGQAYNQPLSLLQSHILIEISATPGVSASTLVDLGLGSQVTIARRLRELADANLVSFSHCSNDARLRLLQLTAKGKVALGKLDKSSNALKDVFAKGFSQQELEELDSLLNKLCELADIPRAANRPQDLPPRAAFRRMARFMGILTTDFMGSGLSSTEWQVLQAIRYSGSGLTAKHLVGLANIDQSGVSRVIDRFGREKLVGERDNPHDRRSKLLEMTPKGFALLENSDTEAIRKLEGPLSTMRPADRYRLAFLLAHYAFGKADAAFDGIVCKNVSTPTEEAEARRWLVQSLALRLTEQPDMTLPVQCVHPKDVTFVAFDTTVSKAPCALLEIANYASNNWEVVSFVIDSELCPSYFRRLEVGILLVRAAGQIADRLRVAEYISWPLAFMDPRIFGVDVIRT